MGRRAELRCCASCEWIYEGAGKSCPKCKFGSYGAKYVYGNKAYRYKETQEPWFDKKMNSYACELYKEIRDTNNTISKTRTIMIHKGSKSYV